MYVDLRNVSNNEIVGLIYCLQEIELNIAIQMFDMAK